MTPAGTDNPRAESGEQAQIIAEAKRDFAEARWEMTALAVKVTRAPWKDRSWRCRFGRHNYGELGEVQIAAAGRYCIACGHIDRFTGAALVECIKTRTFIAQLSYAPDPNTLEGG